MFPITNRIERNGSSIAYRVYRQMGIALNVYALNDKMSPSLIVNLKCKKSVQQCKISNQNPNQLAASSATT